MKASHRQPLAEETKSNQSLKLAAHPEIRVESTGDDVTYDLPLRPLGKLRWFGLVPIAVTAGWFAWLFTRDTPEATVPADTKVTPTLFLMVAIGLAYAVFWCSPAWIGLLTMFGRCRIIWKKRRLIVSDYLGPFGWRRRLPKSELCGLTVTTGAIGNRFPIAIRALDSFAGLKANFGDGEPRWVTFGYPREWVHAIARDLALRAGRSQSVTPTVEVDWKAEDTR